MPKDKKHTIQNAFKAKYFASYDRLIKAELLKHNCSYCYYGHTHIPRSGDFFTNIGSYKDGHMVETGDYIIINDLHLGLYPYSSEELQKIKRILESTKKVTILGDFFDLFYDDPGEIKKEFEDFISIIKKRIKAGTLVYIRGNHDWAVKKHFDINARNFYVDGLILFIHGHTCDPLMSIFPLNVFYNTRMRLGHHMRHTKRIFSYLEKRFLAPNK